MRRSMSKERMVLFQCGFEILPGPLFDSAGLSPLVEMKKTSATKIPEGSRGLHGGEGSSGY